MNTVESAFAVRDKVHVDGCKDLVAVITAVQWRNPQIVNYEVSWIANGEARCSIIEGWRLTEAKR